MLREPSLIQSGCQKQQEQEQQYLAPDATLQLPVQLCKHCLSCLVGCSRGTNLVHPLELWVVLECKLSISESVSYMVGWSTLE